MPYPEHKDSLRVFALLDIFYKKTLKKHRSTHAHQLWRLNIGHVDRTSVVRKA